MKGKVAMGMMLTLLLTTILGMAPNVQPVTAEPGTWTVDDDGPADFPTIQEAVNAANPGDTIYVYNGTYYEHVVLNKTIVLVGENRSTTIIDGGGDGIVVRITANNVVVRGFTVKQGLWGILLDSSSYSSVSENTATNNTYGGIQLVSSSYSDVSENNVANNTNGVYLYMSSNNTVRGNAVASNANGVYLFLSDNNRISGNTAASNANGILLNSSGNNTVSGNTATINTWGIILMSGNNTVFHNNFINNTNSQAVSFVLSTWDNGYPSGGNFWSDYTGVDNYRGPYQNETGSDGIGDTPYIIDADNQDRYPFMNPWTPQAHDVATIDVSPSKTVVGQGYHIFINVTIENQGDYTETFNVTVYADTTIIQTENITLSNGNSTTVTFTWNTTGIAKGNYTISAYAWPVPGEIDTADNNFKDGWIVVAMIGDIAGPDGCGFPDGKVDIRDIACVAKLFGVNYPDPRYDPNRDLTGPTLGVADGKIDIRDIATVAKHFGEVDP